MPATVPVLTTPTQDSSATPKTTGVNAAIKAVFKQNLINTTFHSS
jgi:hypothetical protein